MTYADLLENLKALSPGQLNMDVTVLVSGVDEMYPLREDYPWVFSTEDDDRVDPGTPYIVI